MKNNKYPIGVFDSGLGGLTVLHHLKKTMPLEKFIYFGDTAHIPYGNKSKKTIEKYCLAIIDFLAAKKIKLIIVACNTASSVALKKIKQHTTIPIIDVISPCVSYAVSKTKNKRIGIIGTETTINSQEYQKQIKSKNDKIIFFTKACPLFVPIIEEGAIKQKFVNEIVQFYLNIFKTHEIDTLILGCTHYPIIKGVIQKTLTTKTKIIDSAISTSYYVNNYLDRHNLKSQNKHAVKDEYFVSDKVVRFTEIANMFLKQKTIKIKQVEL